MIHLRPEHDQDGTDPLECVFCRLDDLTAVLHVHAELLDHHDECIRHVERVLDSVTQALAEISTALQLMAARR